MFCGCAIIQLSCVVRAVHRFDIRIVIIEARNKGRPVERQNRVAETDVFDRICMSSVGSVLGLYPSCVGQQPSLEYTTVQCLGAQLASLIPNTVTSQKTVTFNNLSEMSDPARQYYSVRRPTAPLCYLGTKMADPETCDIVSARNENCDHKVSQLCTVEVRPTFQCQPAL